MLRANYWTYSLLSLDLLTGFETSSTNNALSILNIVSDLQDTLDPGKEHRCTSHIGASKSRVWLLDGLFNVM